MFSGGVCEVFRDWFLRTTASETSCFTWSVLKLAQIGTWFSLREKCPSMKFFLVRIFGSWTEYGEIRSIESKCGKTRTRKNSVFRNFSRSVLYYNLQFGLSILTKLLIPWNYNANTIDTAIIRSSRLVMFCKTGILTNFTKFTRKHLRQRLVFNFNFSCQFCKILILYLSHKFCTLTINFSDIVLPRQIPLYRETC